MISGVPGQTSAVPYLLPASRQCMTH